MECYFVIVFFYLTIKLYLFSINTHYYLYWRSQLAAFHDGGLNLLHIAAVFGDVQINMTRNTNVVNTYSKSQNTMMYDKNIFLLVILHWELKIKWVFLQ